MKLLILTILVSLKSNRQSKQVDIDNLTTRNSQMAEREPSRTRQQESALSSRGPNAESSGADVSKPKRRRPKSESTGAATSEHEPRPRRPRPRKEESAGNDASDPETGIPAKPRRHRPPKEESDPQAAGPPKPRRQRPPKEESPEGAQSAPRPRRKRPNPESNPESEPEPGAHRKRRHRPVPDEPPLTKEPEVTAPPSKQEEKEKSDPAITVRGVVGPRDIITIMFLWTIEILHVTISTCLVKFIKENSIRRFTDEIPTRNAEEEGFYIPRKSGGDSWIFIAVTSLIMILMGLFLSLPSSIPIASAIGKYMDQHKYEIMHCGIGVYIFSAILGIMLTITKRVEVVIAMIWFEVSWYAVHPLSMKIKETMAATLASVAESLAERTARSRFSTKKPSKKSHEPVDEGSAKESEVPPQRDSIAAESSKGAASPSPEVKDVPKRHVWPKLVGIPSKWDLIVIFFIWSSQNLYVMISITVLRYTSEHFSTGRPAKRLLEGTGSLWAYIIIVLIAMATVALVLSSMFQLPYLKKWAGFKWNIMCGGLLVYFVSPIVGILLGTTESVAFAVLMSWMEVGWFVGHPIRFWYIFHQVFPISSRWSHLLVTVNLLIIGIVEYIVTLSIKDRNSEEPFPSSFYPVFFGMLAVVGIVWMICAFFVKRFLNPAPGDLNAVKEVYSKTETIEEFNKKQSIVNFVLFPLVMAPALMFPIADVVMDISHNYLPLNSVNLTIGFVPYRPHLVCFLLVLIIAEVLHQLLKFFGSELFNLVMLVISHALVLTALLLITLIIYDTWIIRTRTPSPGDGFAIIVTPYVPSYHVQIGEKITRRTLTFHVVEDLPDDGRIPIRVADKDTGEVYKEDHIVIREAKKSTTDFYHVVNNSIAKRVEIIKIPMKRITHGNYRRFIFMNNAAECSNYRRPELLPKMYPNVKPRGMWINNECLPMVFKFYAEGSDAKKATPFAPPAHNESLDVVVHCIDGYQGVPIRDIKGRLTATCHDTMTLAYYRLLSYLIQTGIIPKPPDPFFPFYPIYHDAEVYPYSITLIISEDISFLNASRRSPRPHYIEVGYPQGVGEHQMLLAECLYGTALALASVAYIHFLWMECPIRFRMLFIFGFFALIFAASSITKPSLKTSETMAATPASEPESVAESTARPRFWSKKPSKKSHEPADEGAAKKSEVLSPEVPSTPASEPESVAESTARPRFWSKKPSKKSHEPADEGAAKKSEVLSPEEISPQRESIAAESSKSAAGPSHGVVDVQTWLGLPKRLGIPSMVDLMVIFFIWSSQNLYVMISITVSRFTSEHFSSGRSAKLLSLSTGSSWAYTIIVLIAMATVALVLSSMFQLPNLKKWAAFKWKIMCWGLFIYFVSPIAGILLGTTESVAFAVVIMWVEIGWFVGHPIRFWYIFHQVFPISSRWSHLLVTVNLLIIGIFEYIVTVSVKDRNSEDPNESSLYPPLFGTLTFASIVWMVCAFSVEKSLNPTPGDLNAVKDVYSKTGTIEEFNMKESIVNFVLFPLVMFPALMFPIADVVMDISHNYLPLRPVNMDIGFVPYRPHLVCFLLVLIIAEVLHQFLKFFSSELFNLVVLVISHALVLAALFLITIIIYTTWMIRSRTPSPGDGFLILVTPLTYHVGIGGKISGGTFTYHVIEDLPDDGRIPIRVTDKDTGEVYADDHIEIRESRQLSIDFYQVVNNSLGRGVEIIKIPYKSNVHGNYRRFLFINNAPECSNYRRPELISTLYGKDNVTPRGMWINNECLPMVFKFYAEGSDAKKATPFAPPAHNESLDIVVHCIDGYQGVPINDLNGRLTVTCHERMKLLYYKLLPYLLRSGIIPGLPNELTRLYPTHFEVEIYPNSNTIVISEDNSGWNASRRTPTPHYVEVDNPQGIGELNMLLAECLYGTALGLASVAYVHFLWMQCPVRFRMLFIFGFFALIFAASSMTKRHLTQVTENIMNVVISTSGFCFSWQVVASVLFYMRILQKSVKRPEQARRLH
ncbi:hypothetical protein GE061_001900 [Apolygus lucorum]|uniref:Uncharacterized protein n=1 Tax=Apolygus lucorum TaxID=248454 RepID=A0A8S9X5B2_APOLU|nr:hypothetical protein GE061_001900 [Apolygus lucorum]